MQESEKWKWSLSFTADSSWPHGLQPTRLLCPWDFPGKRTGAGCHCLLRDTAQNRLYLLDLCHFFGLPSIWTLLGKSSLWIWVGGKDRLLLEDLTLLILSEPPLQLGQRQIRTGVRGVPSRGGQDYVGEGCTPQTSSETSFWAWFLLLRHLLMSDTIYNNRSGKQHVYGKLVNSCTCYY